MSDGNVRGLAVRRPRQHWFGPSSDTSKGSGHPVLFGFPQPTRDYGPFLDGGGYPHEFLKWAYRTMARVSGRKCDPDKVLHLCSGSMERGVTVDIRPETNPNIVADCRDTGLADESFDFILADPPYSKEYAKNLYGTEASYPAPSHIVREACRLLKPGGCLGLLHFTVPIFKRPMRLVNVFGISTGCGYNIRAWTLLQKDGFGPMLWDMIASPTLTVDMSPMSGSGSYIYAMYVRAGLCPDGCGDTLADVEDYFEDDPGTIISRCPECGWVGPSRARADEILGPHSSVAPATQEGQ